jgi:hypothetical protein
MPEPQPFVVERVQTGVRMEKRLLKVLKALAEYHDLTLGDLLEGVGLQRVKDLKKFYGLDLDSRASHRLIENSDATAAKIESACV